MTLLWFLSGIVLILAIARYNKSNKLFWTLLFAQIMGFAGTKMVLQTIGEDEQSNENLVQVYSTQKVTDAEATTLFKTAVDLLPTKVTASNFVSQSFIPEENKVNITLSKVFGKTRDQPLNLIKPPKLYSMKDFLTLHDTG